MSVPTPKCIAAREPAREEAKAFGWHVHRCRVPWLAQLVKRLVRRALDQLQQPPGCSLTYLRTLPRSTTTKSTG